ncbi:MAG: formylglycine-generating enzyme family protein [Dysgonamonadaceae bacterium]|jgi:formylglycine-generating enzyme required for sulfatase activity|nr:formylglycine-generating enzyme family protein [Dysgonamonadaceae bacterium]
MTKVKVFFVLSALMLSALAEVSKAQAQTEPEMIFVQGGTFTMGCTDEQGGDCRDRERPTHQVTLSSFNIGKYEVTQAQWKAIMGSNPSNSIGDNLPVDDVSWDDVQEFIKKLNSKTGKNYRLPTEAEWEYAARGGSESKGYKYSGSDDTGYNLYKVAWLNGDAVFGESNPVGTKQPNELGIYDMSGNVCEWCSDWYVAYSESAQENPVCDDPSNYVRVYRGGCWSSDERECRVSDRQIFSPGDSAGFLGFRLVLPQ